MARNFVSCEWGQSLLMAPISEFRRRHEVEIGELFEEVLGLYERRQAADEDQPCAWLAGAGAAQWRRRFRSRRR